MPDIDNNDLMDNGSGNDNILLAILGALAATAIGSAITGTISYFRGKNKGYKEGFIVASEIYEKKLQKQTEDFLSAKKSYEADRLEYDELLNEYEEYIKQLEELLAQGEKVGEIVDFLKAKQSELDNLRDA